MDLIKKIFAIAGVVISSAVLGGVIVFAYMRSGGYAGEPSAVVLDEKQLADKVKHAVLDELNSGELAKEIDKGIRVYIEEKRKEKQAALARAQEKSAELAKSVQRVSAKRDHVFGKADAAVSLIEYADFKCPYCRLFHRTARQVVESSGGKVNWVYRHYPLSFHNPDAQKLAEASECVAETGGNTAFWKFADLVYERMGAGNKGLALDKLASLVKGIGVDSAAFQRCLDSGSMTARVREDLTEGVRIGVTGTPGNILLNNQTGEVKVLSGNANAETLKGVIGGLVASKEK